MSEPAPETPAPAQQDSNGASDTIEVDKSAPEQPVSAGTGVPLTPDAPIETEPETDPTDGEASTTPSSGSPQQEEAAAPDPRTLDADGNPVPDFYAPPPTPPDHDPSVHAMAQLAVQKVGTGVLVKFEHAVAAVAQFAHQHPALDRVFVQGLLDALTVIEKS